MENAFLYSRGMATQNLLVLAIGGTLMAHLLCLIRKSWFGIKFDQKSVANIDFFNRKNPRVLNKV